MLFEAYERSKSEIFVPFTGLDITGITLFKRPKSLLFRGLIQSLMRRQSQSQNLNYFLKGIHIYLLYI